MEVRATLAQIRAYGRSRPHATKVRIRANGFVEVLGKIPRRYEFGWYVLGRVEDLEIDLPRRAADGDPGALAALSKRKSAGTGISPPEPAPQ